MVIGGFAVGFYGYVRMSMAKNSETPAEKPDIDIWFNPTYDNYYRLLNALEEAAIDVTTLKDEQSPDPRRSYLKYNLPDCTLDLNPSIVAPIKFFEAYGRRLTANTPDGVEISFISVEDLIKDKELMGRPKDIEDVYRLKSRYFPDDID